MISPKRLARTVAVCTLCVLLAEAAQADFVAPNSWTRGDSDTTFQHWDFFTGATDQSPDVADNNPAGPALLDTTSFGSTATGSGNIYSPAGPGTFAVTVPVADVPDPAHDLTAVVQIRSQGTELNLDSVSLNGESPVDYFELDRVALGGFGGTLVDHWFLFNVPYAQYGDGSVGTAELDLTFAGLEEHFSLDQVAIDTAISASGFFPEQRPIPEPTTAMLAGLAAVALFSRRSAVR